MSFLPIQSIVDEWIWSWKLFVVGEVSTQEEDIRMREDRVSKSDYPMHAIWNSVLSPLDHPWLQDSMSYSLSIIMFCPIQNGGLTPGQLRPQATLCFWTSPIQPRLCSCLPLSMAKSDFSLPSSSRSRASISLVVFPVPSSSLAAYLHLLQVSWRWWDVYHQLMWSQQDVMCSLGHSLKHSDRLRSEWHRERLMRHQHDIRSMLRSLRQWFERRLWACL